MTLSVIAGVGAELLAPVRLGRKLGAAPDAQPPRLLPVLVRDVVGLRSEKFEVLDPVVELVSVEVMDDLAAREYAPQVGLHDHPVFKRVMPIHDDAAVALVGDRRVVRAIPHFGPCIEWLAARLARLDHQPHFTARGCI